MYDTGAASFGRLELRLFGTYMGWDKSLNELTYDGTPSTGFRNTSFTGANKWLMGAQMEVWFWGSSTDRARS
jgi:maltoporin